MKSLECQICFNEFDECRRRPRILYCGHTFCSICLKSLLKDGKIACPNCKKSHETDDVENININFFLESLLSPDDTSKSVALDTGYKCKEHFYEQNFFCQTHEQWICRDCTVIKHKPCSHSENCDNKNDCRVVTKTERIDIIKSDKLEELKKSDETYGTALTCHISEFDSKVNSKLTYREDLKSRLQEFTEENDLEIEDLRKKLDFTRDILSNLQKHRNLAEKAQIEITKAHGRNAVEESCRNIENVITSGHEWVPKEQKNIIEEEKNIEDVEITLKEFETLKQKLCDTENVLSDVSSGIRDLNCEIDEHKLTNDCLQSELNESEEKILVLEYKLKKKNEKNISDINELASKKFTIKFNKDRYQDRISRLEKELENSKKNCEVYNERILSLEKDLDNNERSYDVFTKSRKLKDKISVVKTKDLYEIENHLLDHHSDAYLITKKFNENGDKEHCFGKLNLFTYGIQDIVLIDAFRRHFSLGSLLLQCRPLIYKLDSAKFVYLDIGKIQVNEDSRSLEAEGNPFGRLFIRLTGCPRRRQQMVQICSSIAEESWKGSNFTVLRNRDRPGELVTCKYYRKFTGVNSENETISDGREFLYDDLDTSDEGHPILAGNVFGYLDGSAGFSIITRTNYSRDTKWPLIGKVVSGLDFLAKAIQHHDVESIGILSHGSGFITE